MSEKSKKVSEEPVEEIQKTDAEKEAEVKMRFSNIDEVIVDPKFNEILTIEVERLKTERQKAEQGLKAGQKLRRTTFDRLTEKGFMNPESIVAEYRKIIKGQGGHPSIIRTYIIQIVSNIARQVLNHYYKAA